MRIAACINIYLMDLECFLSLVLESEFRMYGLSFPYFSEGPCTCLEGRTGTLALLVVRQTGEVFLRECPDADPVFSVAALICPAVYYRSSPLSVLTPDFRV